MAGGSENVTFPNPRGARLAARLDRPAGKPRAFALFAHCFTCSNDLFAASRISQALSERGFAVLRFDFTGLGASEGEFANTNFSSNLGDVVAAADYLRERYQAPGLLIGHSLGGAAVLAAAQGVPEAKAVATVGAPFHPAHVSHLFKEARAEIEAKGEAEVTLAGRTFTVRKQFLEDLEERCGFENPRSGGVNSERPVRFGLPAGQSTLVVGRGKPCPFAAVMALCWLATLQ
jgi:alpha/beta superfamily hydrolase